MLLNYLPTGLATLQFYLPECKIYLHERYTESAIQIIYFNVKFSFLCVYVFYHSKSGCLYISRNRNKTLIKSFFFFFSQDFYLPHPAGGSQVLLAPPQFLIAPGKWAMLNVEPWAL